MLAKIDHPQYHPTVFKKSPGTVARDLTGPSNGLQIIWRNGYRVFKR
jgi:hypothetical protein